jgi:hypothetical protein
MSTFTIAHRAGLSVRLYQLAGRSLISAGIHWAFPLLEKLLPDELSKELLNASVDPSLGFSEGKFDTLGAPLLTRVKYNDRDCDTDGRDVRPLAELFGPC